MHGIIIVIITAAVLAGAWRLIYHHAYDNEKKRLEHKIRQRSRHVLKLRHRRRRGIHPLSRRLPSPGNKNTKYEDKWR